jgi:hypothetical protein
MSDGMISDGMISDGMISDGKKLGSMSRNWFRKKARLYVKDWELV